MSVDYRKNAATAAVFVLSMIAPICLPGADAAQESRAFSRTVTVTSDPPGATIWEKEGRVYTCKSTVTPAKIDLTFHGESDAKQLLLKKFGYSSQKIVLDPAHDKASATLAKSGAPFLADSGDAPPEVRSLNARLRKAFEEAFVAGTDPLSCLPLEFLSLDLVKSGEEKRFDLGVSLVLGPSDAARKLRVADHSRGNPTERASKMGQAALEGGIADIVARIGAVAAKFPEIRDILVACSYSTTEAVLDTEAWVSTRIQNRSDASAPNGVRTDVIFQHNTNTVVLDKSAVGTLTMAIPLAKAMGDRNAVVKAVLSDGVIANLPGVAGREGLADLVRQHRGHEYSEEIDGAVASGNLAEVKALLADNPLLVFSKEEDHAAKLKGETPLHIAVLGGHEDMMQLLLANGADVDAGDDHGWTPLHFVASGGKADMAQLLLATKADVNARDDVGETPLSLAALEDNIDVARVLLANGADVNVKDDKGWRPLRAAVVKGHPRMEALLLVAPDLRRVTELFLAFDNGDLTKKKQMLNDHPELVTGRDWYGASLLYRAATEGNKDVAELLLAKGADINAKDYQGKTPLHEAARYGYKDVAELLLAKGADINAKDKGGDTPLTWAVLAHSKDVAELLRQHGGHE